MPHVPFGSITSDPQSHVDVASHLADLVRETQASRDPWALHADRGNTVYLHGEYPAPLITKRVINPIQNAILADVVIQTREKIIVKLNPVETGDPGEIYFSDPAMYGMMPPTPLDPKMVQQMQMPTLAVDPMTGQASIDPMTGQPMLQDGAPEETFITVDDKLCAEVWQAVFDRMWKRSRVDDWVRRGLISTEIHGWMVAMYEWDDEYQRHRIRPMSVWQAYIDPTEEAIDNAAYAGIDIVLDANDAARMHPQYAEKIMEMAKEGQPSKPDGNSTLGRADMDYERKVITLRVFWERNQPFPMSEEEALAGGLVEQREVVDVITNGDSAGIGQIDSGELAYGSDRPTVQHTSIDENILPTESEMASSSYGEVASDGSEGGLDSAVQSVLGMGGIPPATRLAYFIPGTDEEIDRTHPEWPTRYGIRQCTVIESIVVDDRECEHFDIPLIHNVNRPIPGRPWGIGEPMFLMNQQKAYNTLVDGMVSYAEFFKNPGAVMPSSAAEALRAETGTAFVKPGSTVEIPDELYMQFQGKIIEWYSPPPMNDAPMQMSQLLKKDINDQSGHTDAIRGILPSAQTSGRAVELLQESGTQMIQQKSQSTESMVERLASLMHFSHVWRLAPSAEENPEEIDVSQIRRIVSKYPDYVLQAIVRKGRAGEFDIDVVVSSGSGAVLAAKKQEQVEKFQIRDVTGEPLQGIEETRNALGVDHTTERQRWEEQSAQMAATAAMQPDQEGGKKKEKGPSKG